MVNIRQTGGSSKQHGLQWLLIRACVRPEFIMPVIAALVSGPYRATAAAVAEGSRKRVSKWIQCRRIGHLIKQRLKPRNTKERGGRRRRDT